MKSFDITYKIIIAAYALRGLTIESYIYVLIKLYLTENVFNYISFLKQKLFCLNYSRQITLTIYRIKYNKYNLH